MRPVTAYLDAVVKEIETVRAHIPKVRMARLHLGGGTPTILQPKLMERLLDCVFGHFQTAAEFEFSVEVDPTEAEPELLKTLIGRGLNRVSIGVQDFDHNVQKSIGRLQSYEQTRLVVDFLRNSGVKSLNLDLLYGLPHQDLKTLEATLEKVALLEPDRLALYGYAHVPWMSKRQVMIDENRLPDAHARFDLAEYANEWLTSKGFEKVGIDHFAKPHDSLVKAAQAGELRRNFQGYTDDPAQTLLGFGASAISKFREGYVQNAVATSDYLARIENQGTAGHKGFLLSKNDDLIAQMIERLMCEGQIRLDDFAPAEHTRIEETITHLVTTFPEVVDVASNCISIQDGYKNLTRILAASLDQYASLKEAHSQVV